MPYAIYSKRTGICSRIVDNLVSLLPSENMIEIDDEASFPRGHQSPLEGQDVNTSRFPLFYLTGSGAPSTNPTAVAYDGDDRPYTAKHPPIYIKPTVPDGARQTKWLDMPLSSYPFAWTKDDLANQKYACVLSQNYPFQVAIGEEFIDDTHIDTGNSSGYVLSNGQCLIAPDGVLVTSLFSFQVTSDGVINPLGTSDESVRQFVFDTYYLNVEPNFPEGVQVSWQGTSWSGDTLTGYWDAVTDEDYPTTKLNGSDTSATKLRSIQLKIQNLTSDVYNIENYLLLLRVRNLPAV